MEVWGEIVAVGQCEGGGDEAFVFEVIHGEWYCSEWRLMLSL